MAFRLYSTQKRQYKKYYAQEYVIFYTNLV
jgi:hypothetical protein